jgi:hypothetical protein
VPDHDRCGLQTARSCSAGALKMKQAGQDVIRRWPDIEDQTRNWHEGERGIALLETRWKALHRIRLCPQRIGAIVAAALVLTSAERPIRREDRTAVADRG